MHTSLRIHAPGGPCHLSVRAGSIVDAVVLKRVARSALLRVLETGERIWLRGRDLWHVMPGHTARVKVDRLLRCADHEPCAHGQVLNVRIDPPALGLWPLVVEPRGPHEPRGYSFEMEAVLPDASWSDPILDAVEHNKAGDYHAAEQILMDLLAADVRCLDAHAHLGNMTFEAYPEHALIHYSIGVAFGEHALGLGFNGKLPWRYLGNRPFLRCLHGMGLTLWRLGHYEAARAALERLISLNPADDQEAFTSWSHICAGDPWEEQRPCCGELH